METGWLSGEQRALGQTELGVAEAGDSASGMTYLGEERV